MGMGMGMVRVRGGRRGAARKRRERHAADAARGRVRVALRVACGHRLCEWVVRCRRERPRLRAVAAAAAADVGPRQWRRRSRSQSGSSRDRGHGGRGGNSAAVFCSCPGGTEKGRDGIQRGYRFRAGARRSAGAGQGRGFLSNEAGKRTSLPSSSAERACPWSQLRYVLRGETSPQRARGDCTTRNIEPEHALRARVRGSAWGTVRLERTANSRGAACGRHRLPVRGYHRHALVRFFLPRRALASFPTPGEEHIRRDAGERDEEGHHDACSELSAAESVLGELCGIVVPDVCDGAALGRSVCHRAQSTTSDDLARRRTALGPTCYRVCSSVGSSSRRRGR